MGRMIEITIGKECVLDPTQVLNPRLLIYFSLASQTLAMLLILILFLLLRRYVGRRTYFHAWTWAWLVLVMGLLAMVVRFQFPFAVSGIESTWPVRVSYFFYELGKFAFLAFLLKGVLLYLQGPPNPHARLVRWLWPLVFGFSLLSVWLSANQLAVLFWQGVVNVVIYLWCAGILLLLPTPRRSLGTRLTGVCLGATGLLWIGYEYALLHEVFPGIQLGAGVWDMISGRNSYLDLILEMLLAFGMILVLFEDARREIDTAHKELRIAHEQLLRESLTDTLTGAYNRRAFNEAAGLEEAGSSFGSVVMFDLDNLKTVNDAYGHKHGDALLQHFASLLRAGMRTSDKLYRLGGDEFLAVMPRAAAEVAEKRMQKLVADAPPLELDDPSAEIVLGVSLGVAGYRSMEDIEAAMHAADRAMYLSKRARKTSPRGELFDGGDPLPET